MKLNYHLSESSDYLPENMIERETYPWCGRRVPPSTTPAVKLSIPREVNKVRSRLKVRQLARHTLHP